jgi:hypothetical protein
VDTKTFLSPLCRRDISCPPITTCKDQFPTNQTIILLMKSLVIQDKDEGSTDAPIVQEFTVTSKRRQRTRPEPISVLQVDPVNSGTRLCTGAAYLSDGSLVTVGKGCLLFHNESYTRIYYQWSIKKTGQSEQYELYDVAAITGDRVRSHHRTRL